MRRVLQLGSILCMLAVVPAATASEFQVVAAVGVRSPEGVEAGGTLAAGTRVELERWGRLVAREQGACELTHVIVGVEEITLSPSETCTGHDAPLELAARVQRGEAFAERVRETDGQGGGALVAALALNSCVFLERVSEELDNRRRCPSGYALRGLRCSGNFCDDKDLMCCPYLDGAPDPTFDEVGAQQISEEFPNAVKSKRFLIGMTCWGPYCDNVRPHALKSSRVSRTDSCDWSAWSAEQPGAWLDCGETRFVAGLRCRGDYCADVGLYCCEAKTEP